MLSSDRRERGLLTTARLPLGNNAVLPAECIFEELPGRPDLADRNDPHVAHVVKDLGGQEDVEERGSGLLEAADGGVDQVGDMGAAEGLDGELESLVARTEHVVVGEEGPGLAEVARGGLVVRGEPVALGEENEPEPGLLRDAVREVLPDGLAVVLEVAPDGQEVDEQTALVEDGEEAQRVLDGVLGMDEVVGVDGIDEHEVCGADVV